MTNMTAEQAIDLLKHFGSENLYQCAVMIERQQAEIVKKDKMLDTAIEGLIKAFDCPAEYGFECHVCYDCDQNEVRATACWLAWLEKEAQGVE